MSSAGGGRRTKLLSEALTVSPQKGGEGRGGFKDKD